MFLLVLALCCLAKADSFLDEALLLQQEYPLIDGHNDLPWDIRKLVNDSVWAIDLKHLSGQTDITRLRKGELGAQFWSVYVPCEMQGKDAVRATMEQIDVVKQMAKKYPETFQVVADVASLDEAFSNGYIASLMGMEGGHSIDGSFGALRQFYDLGARYMTLTHTCNNEIGDSSENGCFDNYDCRVGSCVSGACSETQKVGLTDFGRKVVREMNRLGMIVDISHVSPNAMLATLETAEAPVIFSHSSAKALCDVERNVPDDVLLKLPENGGIVMVTFVSYFVVPDGNATLGMVVDHIDYIVKGICPSWKPDCNPSGRFPGIGVEHIGIGSDFNGFSNPPKGLEDVSRFPHLTAELLRRGYSHHDVTLMIGGNFRRVFWEVEKVKRYHSSTVPAQGLMFPKRECRSQQ